MNRNASARLAAFYVLHFAFCILHFVQRWPPLQSAKRKMQNVKWHVANAFQQPWRRTTASVAVCGNVVIAQLALAQQPVYQQLEADVRVPQRLQIEPVLFCRSPITLSVASSADGKHMRTVDANGRVWQRPVHRSGEPLLVVETNCEPACAVLSADGRWLAFGEIEGSVAMIDLDSTRVELRDDRLAERAAMLIFSPDSKLLASVAVGGEVRVWEVASGKRIHEFATEAGPVQTIAFSPDNRRLAVASHSRDIKLYNLNDQNGLTTGTEPQIVRVAGARVTAIAFTPDARQLVVATSDGAATLHDVVTDREPRVVGRHPFAIWSITFEQNGRRIAAGSWDGSIKLWDTTSWELLQTVKKHDESVTAIVFDGEQGLISAGLDGRLLGWLPEVSSISPDGMIAGRDDSVWAAVYSPDGKRLFVGGRGNRFELWDVDNKELLVTRSGHPTTRCAAFSPDGATLATGGDDGAVLLCDAATGQPRSTLLRHPGAVSALVFADAGNTLISACDGGLVKVWDVGTGQERASWREHQQQIYCAAVSPDEKWLLTGGGNWTTGDPGELLVWERETGHVRTRLAGHKLSVWAIVFTPDGERFFSSDSSGAVKVWNMETLKEERTLQHPTWLRPLALSHDASTLAVGRGDGSVRLWDTATWTEKASCDGNKAFTFWLQYSPDGKSLASGGVDGTVRFWHPP
jgi:WD40 repeat protein